MCQGLASARLRVAAFALLFALSFVGGCRPVESQITGADGGTPPVIGTCIVEEPPAANELVFENLGAAQGETIREQIAVPAGLTAVVFTLEGGEGDADLYVRRGGEASVEEHDCSSFGFGDERCKINDPSAGEYSVALYGYGSFSGVTLRVVFEGRTAKADSREDAIAEVGCAYFEALTMLWSEPGAISVVNTAIARRQEHPEFQIMTVAEVASIYSYTSDHYYEINRALRGIDGPEALEELQLIIDTADDGLRKVAEAGGAYTGMAYRGTIAEEEADAFVDQYLSGDTFSDPAFLSTSRSAAERYVRAIRMNIRSKTGIYVAPIADYPEEKEVLFRPGTTFRIVSKMRDPNKPKWEVVLEEI